MKYLRSARPWLLRAYLVYSVILDAMIIGTAVWYFFTDYSIDVVLFSEGVGTHTFLKND